MKTKALTITNARGLKLAALLDLPPGDGPFPLCIMLHGLGGYKEELHHASLAEALDQHGVASLRFDTSGSGASEGTWEEDYRMSHYVQDVLAVERYVQKELPMVDQNNTSVYGHSMGGMIALFVARDIKARAVVSSQPALQITQALSIVPEMEQWEKTGWLHKKTSRFDMKLPYDFALDADKYNSVEVVKHLRIPILLIAGSDDNINPPSHIKAIYHAAHEPKQYLEFLMDHHYKNQPDILPEVTTAIVKFLLQYLLPGRT